MKGAEVVGIEQCHTNSSTPNAPYQTRKRPRRPYSDTSENPNGSASTGGTTPDLKQRQAVKRNRKSTLVEHKSTVARKQADAPKTNRISYKVTDGLRWPCYTLQDGTELEPDDCVYLVCEPPGEPYYLARIMEFTRLNQDSEEIDAVRVNWFYRPRDIQRQNSDTRLLFATMHSDLSPLHAIRGKCRILHKSQIIDSEDYRRQPNCFYFERLFDKFMRRQYEIIPVNQVINVPENVRLVLQRRWKYVVVEVNRAKELAMEHRACRSCGGWCANKDSVRCAMCKSDFHMQCVQPPLPRKPTRGFAWTCTPCSRAEACPVEISQLQSSGAIENDTNGYSTDAPHAAEEASAGPDSFPDRSVDASAQNFDEAAVSSPVNGAPYPRSLDQPEQWPYRYLGIHCNVNDAVDHDDRIYPRAASRLGPRYQASVQEWPGRPIEYFERPKRSIKRTAKAMKGKRSDERAALESPMLNQSDFENEHLRHRADDNRLTAGLDTDCPLSISDLSTDVITPKPATIASADRPLWLQEKPPNYLARGDGKTSQRIWVPPTALPDGFMEQFWQKAEIVAKKLKVDVTTPNFMDRALSVLCDNNFNCVSALQALAKLTRKAISQPSFDHAEKIKFEASVLKNGSELSQVAQDVGSKSVAECVRFYYNWKKTPQGSQVWASSEARKPKSGNATTREGQDTSHASVDAIGDSSDDSAYSSVKATKYKQSFQCKFCETTVSSKWRRAPGTSTIHRGTVVALCKRCAELWRKYAVAWERPEEVYKKLHEGGSRGRKRRLEEELLKDLPADGGKPEKSIEISEVAKISKKIKKADREENLSPSTISNPDLCEVCRVGDLSDCKVCTSCQLRVHSTCYGQDSGIDQDPWLCDTCLNNKNPMASTNYICVLCAYKAEGRCPGALKRTTGNNWAHITCAVWMNGLFFGDVSTLQPVEGISSLPLARWAQMCEVCHTDRGMCVECTTCQAPLHVECASQAGYTLGFVLHTVKSSQSRRESLALVRLGAVGGLMLPVVHCPAHDLTGIHAINEPLESGQSAISLFNKTYKASTVAASRSTRRGRVEATTIDMQTLMDSRVQELAALKKTPEAEPTSTLIEVQRHLCSTCGVQDSPVFYVKEGNTSAQKLEQCHRCHYLQAKISSTIRGTDEERQSTSSLSIGLSGDPTSTEIPHDKPSTATSRPQQLSNLDTKNNTSGADTIPENITPENVIF